MLGPVVRKGDVVTDFELPDETGAPRRLSGLLADGPVVLFFYPAAVLTCAQSWFQYAGREDGGWWRRVCGA
jgi:peroxiredoxin